MYVIWDVSLRTKRWMTNNITPWKCVYVLCVISYTRVNVCIPCERKNGNNMKRNTYLNSARIGDHPDITFYCQKRVFRETKHFSSSFSMWYFSIFSTETGWKFPTYLWGLITEEKSEIRQKLTKIRRLFTKCIYNFGTYFN